jgi:hypothetical protein
MLDNKDHSDIIIKTKDTEFYAHRLVLKLRTSFFEDKIKAMQIKDDKLVTVTIEEAANGGYYCTTHAVWRFLNWCYTGDYSGQSQKIGLNHGKTNQMAIETSRNPERLLMLNRND